jgi:hypothetical protein
MNLARLDGLLCRHPFALLLYGSACELSMRSRSAGCLWLSLAVFGCLWLCWLSWLSYRCHPSPLSRVDRRWTSPATVRPPPIELVSAPNPTETATPPAIPDHDLAAHWLPRPRFVNIVAGHRHTSGHLEIDATVGWRSSSSPKKHGPLLAQVGPSARRALFTSQLRQSTNAQTTRGPKTLPSSNSAEQSSGDYGPPACAVVA